MHHLPNNHEKLFIVFSCSKFLFQDSSGKYPMSQLLHPLYTAWDPLPLGTWEKEIIAFSALPLSTEQGPSLEKHFLKYILLDYLSNPRHQWVLLFLFYKREQQGSKKKRLFQVTQDWIWGSNILLQHSSSCTFHDTRLDMQKGKDLAVKHQMRLYKPIKLM